jgi:hypothetical protein
VKQDERQRGFGPFVGKAVQIAPSIPFQQAMGLHFANVIAELSDGISVSGQAKAGEDGLMDVGGAPSVKLRAAVQEYLHKPHHSCVVDLDSGDFGCAGSNGQSNLLEERKVDVNI